LAIETPLYQCCLLILLKAKFLILLVAVSGSFSKIPLKWKGISTRWHSNGCFLYCSSESTSGISLKVDKMMKDLHELPNEIGACSAALEENLAKNMENFIKDMYKVNEFLYFHF